MAEDTSGFLMGGSVPSAKFEAVGDSVEGTVTAKAMRQQTDFDSNEPLFWDNGEPKMQLVVTLATEERDDEIEDDDGQRRIFVRFKLKDAVVKALKAAKCKDVELGAYMVVELTGHEPRPKGKKGQPAKLYEVTYTAPGENTSNFLGGNDEETGETGGDDDGWPGDDDYHYTDADGDHFVYSDDAADWVAWEKPKPKPPAKKAPAKKAPAKKAPAKAVAAKPGF